MHRLLSRQIPECGWRDSLRRFTPRLLRAAALGCRVSVQPGILHGHCWTERVCELWRGHLPVAEWPGPVWSVSSRQLLRTGGERSNRVFGRNLPQRARRRQSRLLRAVSGRLRLLCRRNLAHELQRTGGTYAVGAACIGGGQGIAVVLERAS